MELKSRKMMEPKKLIKRKKEHAAIENLNSVEKETQISLMNREIEGLPSISISSWKITLKELANHGKLVPDELIDEFIITLLSKRLESGKDKGESGYSLDGFPRTVT